jgi:hypothetical protein
VLQEEVVLEAVQGDVLLRGYEVIDRVPELVSSFHGRHVVPIEGEHIHALTGLLLYL